MHRHTYCCKAAIPFHSMTPTPNTSSDRYGSYSSRPPPVTENESRNPQISRNRFSCITLEFANRDGLAQSMCTRERQHCLRHVCQANTLHGWDISIRARNWAIAMQSMKCVMWTKWVLTYTFGIQFLVAGFSFIHSSNIPVYHFRLMHFLWRINRRNC